MTRHTFPVLFSLLFTFAASAAGPTRDQMVLTDRDDVLGGGRWIYNDLDKGLAEAKQTGKPLLVALRCVPCVACAAFDKDVLRADAELQKLLDRFVRVRIVTANGLDLSLFQFDTDISFAAFFLNADRTLYGRFGTRSDRKEADKDITMEGFRAALAGALELHKGYPKNKTELAGKQPLPVKFKTPEQYPSLSAKYTSSLNYTTGKVAASCIHCHQIGEAQRKVFRAEGQVLSDDALHIWPMPDAVGISLDPKTRAKVAGIAAGSAADRAGLKAGDELLRLAGQPLLSIADAQWVLHHAKNPDRLAAEVRRDGQKQELTLELENDWRRRADFSWRVSTWELRRMVTGGLVLKELDDADRKSASLDGSTLALRVDHVGQYSEHAAGKKAGFQKNDVIVSFDGLSARQTEGDVLRQLLQNRKPGQRVPVTVLRAGNKVKLELPMQ